MHPVAMAVVCSVAEVILVYVVVVIIQNYCAQVVYI